jgi:hypothetical protein
MKNNYNCFSRFTKVILILLALSTTVLSAYSQEKSETKAREFYGKHFYIGLGFRFEIISPGAVDDYIQSYYERQSYETVNTDIYLSMIPHGELTFRINRFVDVIGMAEYGWAPKIIQVSGGSSVATSYSLNRGSFGVLSNLHVPVGGHNTLFFGGGILYHNMKFSGLDEKFSNSTIAPRLQTGFSFNIKNFNPQFILAADFASTEGHGSKDDTHRLKLNYNGVMFGININF